MNCSHRFLSLLLYVSCNWHTVTNVAILTKQKKLNENGKKNAQSRKFAFELPTAFEIMRFYLFPPCLLGNYRVAIIINDLWLQSTIIALAVTLIWIIANNNFLLSSANCNESLFMFSNCDNIFLLLMMRMKNTFSIEKLESFLKSIKKTLSIPQQCKLASCKNRTDDLDMDFLSLERLW